MRIRVVDLDRARVEIESKRFIWALWHSRILLLSYFYRRLGAAILVSKSKDPEIIVRTLEHQGRETIRRSTLRHGVLGTTKLVKAFKEEIRHGVVVPDGPRGPPFRVRPAVITLAKRQDVLLCRLATAPRG